MTTYQYYEGLARRQAERGERPIDEAEYMKYIEKKRKALNRTPEDIAKEKRQAFEAKKL